jgi:hypothetical protein
MVVIAAGVGALAAWLGYDLARGQVFGLIDLDALTGGAWDVSISASMVVMMFVLFVLAWVFAPRRGLLARTAQRWLDRRKTHESPIAKSGEMRHNLSQNR